jgi:hypothetical protein
MKKAGVSGAENLHNCFVDWKIGLLNHDWSAWRSADAANYTADWAAKTLK